MTLLRRTLPSLLVLLFAVFAATALQARTWSVGMKQFILALGLWSCILSTSASTLEITYSDISPFSGAVVGGESLLLRGEIAPGDYERLLQVIRRDQHRFWRSAGFVLASPGGDIQEALRIARLVKGTYSTVFVGATFGPCISACFFIYSAAARREAGVGTLGIHRPYIDAHRLASMSASEAERLQRLVFKQARSYLEDQDVPTNLIDKMFQQASTQVYWLSRAEVEEQLGRSPPWYEQFLIARCGLDKSLERQYWSNHDKQALPHLISVASCGDRLSAPSARDFLRAELSVSPSR